MSSRSLRMTYNAPVILTFSLLALTALVVDMWTSKTIITPLFAATPYFRFWSPIDYVRLFSYIVIHADWTHFSSNFILILLLGPMLEEKYGSIMILVMMLITAFATSIINVMFFTTGLVGASGIVFLFIVLSSFANSREGEIPVTFLVVGALFFSNEVMNALANDNVSQFGHILGGVCGAGFGYCFRNRR
ncbi:MAG: rhomboid family intramembrane serine protease [bacterium]|nr:rhomboid family intramembrane serine protease [bacterium]